MAFAADSHLHREVAGQADDWAAVVRRLADLAPALPPHGSRLAVLGCGTSYYMAQSYAWLREFSGHGETDAFAASENRLERAYDHVLALTRSGTTTEVIDVLRGLRERGVPTTVVTAVPDSPAAGLADQVVLLQEVDEQSVVQTRFATTTLALLRAVLGEDLTPAIVDARAVLAEPEETALAGLADVEQVTFVGTGWTVGLAEEAALKLRESAQFWTESYSAMEYRHGPIAIATAGRAIWAMGPAPDGLAEQVAATGARFEHRDLDPLAELVRVHRLCLVKARQADVDPDHPRHLTRSVVLGTP
ncbi:MAG TPA: SIS domain-containing protein [Lapillicoccus sp.]|nr:SIS domain-containing protein [Lapillicoccus sp.]